MREESPNGTQLGSVNNARALPMPGFEKKDLRRMDLVIDLDDSIDSPLFPSNLSSYSPTAMIICCALNA